MRLRLLASVATVAACALALPSNAATAPKPQIIDEAGDSQVPMDELDIVSGLFTTSGTGTGKKYKPTTLEITITYAAEPSTNPLATQVVTFNLAGCGTVKLQQYYSGTSGEAACAAAFEPAITASGNALQIKLPFTVIGSTLKAGAKLTELRTYTTGAEPLLGTEWPPQLDPSFVSDNADTSAAYIVK